VFIIGIDPHKGSHTAVAIDGDERLVGELLVCADRRQRERLLDWAAEFEPRVWAVEGATGTGALLAQQLVGAGETVLDVPPCGCRKLVRTSDLRFCPSGGHVMRGFRNCAIHPNRPPFTHARFRASHV
jgi:transposase